MYDMRPRRPWYRIMHKDRFEHAQSSLWEQPVQGAWVHQGLDSREKGHTPSRRGQLQVPFIHVLLHAALAARKPSRDPGCAQANP